MCVSSTMAILLSLQTPAHNSFPLNWHFNTRIRLRAAIVGTQELIIGGIVQGVYGSFGLARLVKLCRNPSSLASIFDVIEVNSHSPDLPLVHI